MKLALTTLMISLGATAALAHPGAHEMTDAGAAVQHFLNWPDHAGWLIVAAIVVASVYATRRLIQAKTRRK